MTRWRLTLFVLATFALAGAVACEDNAPRSEADATGGADVAAAADASGDVGADGVSVPDVAATADMEAVPDTGEDTAPNADVAAADGAGDAGDDTADDADGGGDVHPWVEDPAVCGAPEYQWLPPEDVGAPVIVEEMLVSNLSPDAVASLLESAGSDGIVVPTHGIRNIRLRYTTQDRGRAVEATAVIGMPMGLPEGASAPVVLWLHGLTGFNDDCAPSRRTEEAIAAALMFASQGYVTVSPDYYGMLGFGDPSPEGTIHPALVGESVALTSLDAVRAAAVALRELEGAPTLDPSHVVLFGGSQGGHASFFTELYAPYYAPELTIRGVAAALAPTDLLAHGQEAVRSLSPITAALSAALVGMAQWYGQSARLGEMLAAGPPKDMVNALPAQMVAACDARNIFDDLASVEDVYTAEFIAAVDAGDWEDVWPWGCVLAENSVGRSSVPRISATPFLLVDAETDELVRAEVERTSVERLCGQGYDIEFVECAGAGHLGLAGALPRVMDWIVARLEGEPLTTTNQCVVGPPETCAMP